jgi:hypothetical protein
VAFDLPNLLTRLDASAEAAAMNVNEQLRRSVNDSLASRGAPGHHFLRVAG